MKMKKILSVFMIVLTIFSMLSIDASALTWDGSSAGGSTNAVNGNNKGYVIRDTVDDNCVVGYRFSVVNSAGNLKVNKVIDVFRNTSNGDNAYSTSAKFSTKYNKKQLIANKDAKLTTTSNKTNCYKEKDMGFVSKLPNPSGVKTWQAYETNINKVLTKIGVGTVSNMSYGDKVIIEPLFDVCLAGEYQALTVTEIAYCGRAVKGGSSNGGTSNGTSSTWGFIANYTNRIWPNKLYTPDGQGLWTAATKIADGSKETFNNILTKGYGAGIAYTESKAPVLTIAYDCYGSSVKITDSSKGFTLADYNRICSTTSTHKTIAGTANVFYNTVTYDNTLGTNGLHDFSTFGLSAPTGYKFKAWHGAKGDFNESTQYKASQLSDDIKNGDTYEWLTATFEPITYSVRFNGNGSTSGSMSNESFTYDVAKALTANAFKREFTVTYNYNGSGSSNTTAKASATFNGWAKTSTGIKYYNDRQSVKNLASTQGAIVDIYAKWTDASVTLPTPTRTGYTFSGWYTSASGGTKVGNGGDKYTPTKNITLYAHWSGSSYTVSYNANGGSGAPSAQTKTYGVDLTLSSTKPTRTGYTFSKWNTKSDGSGTSYNPGGKYTSNASVTLYAQWTPNTYTVTYNANGGSGAPSSQTKTYGVDLTLSSTKPTRTGYTFSKWNTKSDGSGTSYNPSGKYTSNASVTLYAQWTPNTYTVKYYLDGVEQTALNQTCTYGTSYKYPSLPSKSGYTVSGWWSGSSSSSKDTQYSAGASFSNLTSTNGGTISRYAYSDSKSYTVSYYIDGVEQTSLKQNCYYDSTYNYPAVPTKTGYVISGWWSGSSASSKGTQYAAGASFSNLTSTDGGTVKRYAYSTPITYEVKFNGNGATSGSMNNQKFTYDIAQNLTGNAYKRVFTVTYDYANGNANSTANAVAAFNGWAKTASGSVSYTDKQNVINLATVQDTVVNVYAKWTDGSVTLPTPERTGYIFDGWYTTPDGTSKIGDGGDKYTPSKDITVYAHWKPITYSIVFNGNGADSGSTASMTMTYNEAKNLTANGFVRDGYKFVKWNTKADGSGTAYEDKQSVINLTTVNGAVITLYAQWNEIQTLRLEAVRPNADYREGTQVISSFNIINEGGTDCIPDNNISVIFKVYKDSTVIKTVTLENVVVPANEKNLLYFKWTVPEDIGSSTIYISGEIVSNGKSDNLIKNAYSTCKYTVSSTPDTQYEYSAPENFSVPASPVNSNTTANWSEWKYENCAFKKYNYGIGISDELPSLAPAMSANAFFNNGVWTMKSGYGVEITLANGMKSISGYTMPTSDSYTAPQYSTVLFPEFSFLNTLNNYRTLELVNNQWLFRENGTYGRIHFTPLWYPDGFYSVNVVQRDCWTPAGMISRTINTKDITISGSAYDDWYLN